MYWRNRRSADLSELVGETIKTITGLSKHSDEVTLCTESGQEFLFYHDQDCCENVSLEDFECDDITGGTIVSAEKVTSSDDFEIGPINDYDDSYTWTFYKIETNKGGLFMRWYGASNGYYGEGVDFCEVMPDNS